MKAPHPHLPAARLSTGAPALIAPTVLGDTNVSAGVVGLMLAILALVLVLLVVIAVEVAGEHRYNVDHRHQR